MKRSLLLASTVAVLVMSLGACTSKTGGIAGGSPTTSSTGGSGPSSRSSSPPATSSSKSGASSPTKNIATCSLLTSGDMSSLQLTGGTESNLTSSRGCDYHYTSNTYSFGTAIYDALGVKDIQGNPQLQPVKIGNHDAVQFVVSSICIIAIKVTESSRVEVSVAANGDAQKACSLARPGAEIVEKKLP
ncbi:DUF3558 family protein [Actinocrispum wychmicini]|uniref:Uncharacterized protein DUF3558 n=1 Tax=Actinocrispum wychmicini TaxID=1213861 RepID=A0A4R2JXK9_9PSEU|nr:DUF3558 family protein [Actinocrispum wychmicini]TCO65283.1 uncharacterized protein DUF3558 [Actinocrispum wychmicini]